MTENQKQTNMIELEEKSYTHMNETFVSIKALLHNIIAQLDAEQNSNAQDQQLEEKGKNVHGLY